MNAVIAIIATNANNPSNTFSPSPLPVMQLAWLIAPTVISEH